MMQNKQKKLKLSSLSLFMPAYNEAGNIREAIEQALVVLPKVAKQYEIIVINDGSKDNTLQIAKTVAEENTPGLIRVINQRNKGYGGALKRGFKEARYDWIFFTDSDLQFDLEELVKFIPETKKNDLVIGYRKERAEGLKRKTLARMLKIWNRVILGFPRQIKDIDCAFKLIRRDVIKRIQPLFSDGAMISTEMLLKSYLDGYKIAQIGVSHYKRFIGAPTGSNLKVIGRAVKDTFTLRQDLYKEKIKMAHHQTLAVK